jgi:hypothetical protein
MPYALLPIPFIPPVIRPECHHSWKKSVDQNRLRRIDLSRSVNRGADTVAIVHDRNQPSTPMSMWIFDVVEDLRSVVVRKLSSVTLISSTIFISADENEMSRLTMVLTLHHHRTIALVHWTDIHRGRSRTGTLIILLNFCHVHDVFYGVSQHFVYHPAFAALSFSA